MTPDFTTAPANASTVAKLFVALAARNPADLDLATRTLTDRFGPPDLESDCYFFDDFTHYYEREMGSGLQKKFLAFASTFDPAQLVEVKLEVGDLEQQWCENRKRRVNIDPGYVNAWQVVLASHKNNAHRIYLGRGVFCELTLLCRNGQFEPLPWTYPDYRSAVVLSYFQQLRSEFLR